MVAIQRLDNGNVLVSVRCSLKSGAVRQCFVTPGEGGAAEGVEEMPFVRILGRAFKWREMLVTGVFRDRTALIRALGVDKNNVTAVLRLPYLSPAIVERVLAGELPDASVRRYGKITSPFWHEQHEALGLEW